MWELLKSILRGIDASKDRENYTARRLDYLIHRLLGFRFVAGLVINKEGFITMSGAQNTTYTLTNAANPALATRFLGVIDIENGTTLPTVTSSDTTKLAIVAATALKPAVAADPTATPPVLATPAQFTFGAYPVDQAGETSDAVTATVSLPGQPDIVLNFVVSGTPVPPPPAETDALDTTSSVAVWANAPALPATPV